MSWIESGVRDIANAIREGKTSACEVLEDYITQIERYNPSINALVVLDFEGARTQAKAIDQRRSHGEALGPLAGVPVSIKEAFAVEGMATTCGFESYLDQVPTFDAPAVQALKRADAVTIGKSNIPTSLSGFGCKNPVYGQTSNPWSNDRTPGGSSGGSGAAIASRFSALDLASDLSGSIRIPSSWCGVTGFRPSPGKLSKRGHLPWPLDTALEPPESVPGLIGVTASDLAYGWQAVLSTTPGYQEPKQTLLPTTHNARSLRIGCWLGSDVLWVSQEVAAALLNVTETLSTLGHNLQSYQPQFDEAEVIQLARRLTDAEITFGLNEEVWESWDHKAFTTRNYLQDLNTIERLRQMIDRDLKRFDIIICPATPIVAPTAKEVDNANQLISVEQNYMELRSISDWSLVTSIFHLPSVTIPIGLSKDKLPIGMQVVSRCGMDLEVLFAAQVLELVTKSIGRPDLLVTT